MRKAAFFACIIAVLFFMCACAPADDVPIESDFAPVLTNELPSEKDPIAAAQQEVAEYLSGLGYEVVNLKQSKSMLEFMITLDGFSDQDLSSAPENWEEIKESAISAAIEISEMLSDLDGKSIVFYLQDTAGNNCLTISNGRQSYNIFSESSSGGYNPPTITLEEFNAIKTGMTYQEVYDIIGGSGSVLSEADFGLGEAYRTVIREWSGEGQLGANANVTFQGGKVSSKAQYGLE